MRALGRLAVVIAAAIGAMTASQFPEFAQQYRQRLGGALDEIRQIVASFDADARRNQLTRDQALGTYVRSGEPFLRDQGTGIEATIGRYELLSDQQARLERAPAYLRPVVVMSGADKRVAQGAWADFEPAIPVTPASFVWAALGFFLLGGLVSLIRQLAALAMRRSQSRGRASPYAAPLDPG